MDPVKVVYYVLPLVVVALVAAVYQFGYPLLITLAVGAAFLAIFMIVGFTALDLVKGMAPAKPRAAARVAAQAA
jgi:hypothetical protein